MAAPVKSCIKWLISLGSTVVKDNGSTIQGLNPVSPTKMSPPSFQSNPGPSVLGGLRTTRLSVSSHDNVTTVRLDSQFGVLTTVLLRTSNAKWIR